MWLSAGAASQKALGLTKFVAGVQLLPSLAEAVATGLAGLSGLGLAWLLVLSFTFVFGRFYCSTLCPLGLFQDGAAWVSRVARKLVPLGKSRASMNLDSRSNFALRSEVSRLSDAGGDQATKRGAGYSTLHARNSVHIHTTKVAFEELINNKGYSLPGRLLLATVGVLAAIFTPAMLAWLEPYALAARFGSAFFGTGWELAGELALRSGFFLPAEPLRFDPAWMAAALVPGLLVLVAAGLRPRLFCRWLCPAGALLRLVANRSVFGFRIKGEVCTSCGACQKVCRTGAADSVGRRIDNGACVGCFDCQVICPVDAIHFGREIKPRVVAQDSILPRTTVDKMGHSKPEHVKFSLPESSLNASSAGVLQTKADTTGLQVGKAAASKVFSRRNFMLAGGVGLAASALTLPAIGLGLRPVTARLVTLNGKSRAWASPPGSGSVERFNRLCLSCGLCARACPSGVLRQGMAGWKFPAVLEPYMDYARGFCQFECVACGLVCPSGAIQRLSIEAKTTVAVARSSLDLPKCIVVEKGTPCGACAEHCPTGALSMERVPAHRYPIPVLDETLCVGCGACETVCPSEPAKALIVSGLAVHEIARVLPERPGSAAQSTGRPEGELAGENRGGENGEASLGETEPGLESEAEAEGDTALDQPPNTRPDTGLDGGVDGFPF